PEAQTKEQLLRLLKTYDVSRWIFTKSIVIDERAIPHSHPVLTLHARHLQDDELLLSTFVHEQFHWFWCRTKRKGTRRSRSCARCFRRSRRVGPKARRTRTRRTCTCSTATWNIAPSSSCSASSRPGR